MGNKNSRGAKKSKPKDELKSKPQDELLSDAREGDIVVLVLGTTGAGRSTFINSYLNQNLAPVSHTLNSCTLALKPFTIPYPQDTKRRLVLVDTPGFNSTDHSDTEILKRTVAWLNSCSRPGKTCGGLIYLHDITDTKICSETLNQILESFQSLSAVVYATTRSEKLPPQTFNMRNNELQKKYLKNWIERGASIFHLLSDSPASAQALVNVVVSRCS